MYSLFRLGLLSSEFFFIPLESSTKFALAWAFVVLGDNYDLETRAWNPDSLHILKQQDFWFALGMTIL
jgi:hypothetical protein